MNEPVIIDPELQSLIPPLTQDEFKQLEDNCKRDGILDSLKVWHGILIDGHNRYRIAEEWDLNYTTEEMDFPDKEAVVGWIIMNQFGRRNLSAYDRSILALKLKPMIAEKAKERMMSGKKDPDQKSGQGKTDKELAKVAGVSHDTIHKVETIEQQASESLKQQLRSGEKSINQAWLEIKDRDRKRNGLTAKASLERAEQRHEEYQNSTTVSIDDMRQEKKDLEEIADSKIRKIRNAMKDILFIGASMHGGDMDFSVICKSGVDTDLLKKDIKTAMTILSKILKEIER